MTPKKMLIIEDDLELSEQLSEAFIAEGYAVKHTQSAVKGEKLIKEGDHDVILLDFKMPMLSALDILKKLKAENIRKNIFVFSGKFSVEQELKEADLLDMVTAVITKPMNFQNLLDRIKTSTS